MPYLPAQRGRAKGCGHPGHGSRLPPPASHLPSPAVALSAPTRGPVVLDEALIRPYYRAWEKKRRSPHARYRQGTAVPYDLSEQLPDPDLATPMLGMSILPYGIGLLVLLAAVVTLTRTGGAILLTVASAMSHDLYAKLMVPNATERAKVTAGRIGVVVFSIIPVFLALRQLSLNPWKAACCAAPGVHAGCVADA